MSLTLVAALSVGIVSIGSRFALSITILTILVAIVLVVDTEGLTLLLVVFLLLPRLNGDNSSGKNGISNEQRQRQ